MSDKNVVIAAVQWWEGRRPISYTEEDHIENPCVNCNNDRERYLSIEIAKRIRALKKAGLR